MARRFLFALLVATVAMVAITTLAQAKEGRWKLDDGVCYFDASDEGPDQCSVGRWKVDGSGACYFDSSDAGPDQCAPAPSGESDVTPAEVPVSAGGADGAGPDQNRHLTA